MGKNMMVITQAPVTATEQCPVYRLLVAEREALNAAIARSDNGAAPRFEPTGMRARVAGMIQEHICARRACGARLRPAMLTQIEQAIKRLPESEQRDILDALASCLAGCTLRR